MRKHSVLFLLLALLICSLPCTAQTTPNTRNEAKGEDEVVRIDTTLVNVLASVVDRRGRYVPGLRREDFRVYEDGVAQQIVHFAAVEEPFTVALLLDTSGSTRFRLKDMKDAAVNFVEQLRLGDRVIVVSFNDKVEVLAEATGDRDVLREAIGRAGGGDGTHLYDAVEFASRRLSGISGRKALILFTDGIDNVSRFATRADSLRDVQEMDALVYALQYDTFTDETKAVVGGAVPGVMNPSVVSTQVTRVYPAGFGAKDYAQARDYMQGLADATGARYYHADDLPQIREAFARIADELRWQYSLGYYPGRQVFDGQPHAIKVRVNVPNLVARARRSYVRRPLSERLQGSLVGLITRPTGYRFIRDGSQ